jgi:hypothetical protein
MVGAKGENFVQPIGERDWGTRHAAGPGDFDRAEVEPG